MFNHSSYARCPLHYDLETKSQDPITYNINLHIIWPVYCLSDIQDEGMRVEMNNDVIKHVRRRGGWGGRPLFFNDACNLRKCDVE